MATRFNTDPKQGAFHHHMIDHISGPLVGGAVRTDLDILNGRIAVTWQTREPLLWLAPARDLQDEVWTVSVRLSPGGPNVELPSLTFASFTAKGSALPLTIPPVNEAGTAVPFVLGLRLRQQVDGSSVQVRQADFADFLTAGIIEGTMGRLLFLLGTEKHRIRREGNQINAMRQLRYTKRHALDRLGADLGVPRFAEDIRFRRTSQPDEPFGGEIITRTETEPDNDYRRRLGLYRPYMMPNRKEVLKLLNGPGPAASPNNGLLAELGLDQRFNIIEDDNPFGIAIHLIAVGHDTVLPNFLNFIKRVHLIFPVSNTINNRIHRNRYLPRFRGDAVDDLRNRLAKSCTFDDPTSGLAPMLAEKFDVVGRCLAALNLNIKPRIIHAQLDDGGSRYELGLGAEVATFAPSQLNRIVQAMNQYQAQETRHDDAEIDALLREMQPVPQADDSAASWFYQACGFQTVHRLASKRLYLSHFPVKGMVIAGPSTGTRLEPLDLEVRYHAEGDPGTNAMLIMALQKAAQTWSDSGGTAWTAISDAQAPSIWARALTIDNASSVAMVLRAAGLPVLNDPAQALAALPNLPLELHETITFPPTFSNTIINNVGDAITQLRQLVINFEEAGIASILPLVLNDGRIAFILGAVGLPLVGVNLSQRRATGFRWYITPIQAPETGRHAEFKPIGSRTTFTGQTAGLYALVAVGYARVNQTDPYEYRVELPEKAVLNLKQYEFLINILERAYPVGVEINTYSIRRDHVDLDGDGTAEPLKPDVSRTYRPFVRKRNRGQEGVAAEQD